MVSNRLDRQIKFLTTFFPIKYLIFFVSVVYLNLFLINVVVPLAIYVCLSSVSGLNSSTFLHFNSLTANSDLVGEKLVLFGKYVLNFYIGITHYILRESKTWHAKIYLPTQWTNWRILLTSAKKIRFWPSTHVIDAANFVKIASYSGQAEVIARSMRYQTLWTDKILARNYRTTKLV